MKQTKVINLFGGPGSGKSTVALGVTYHLKAQERNVELVREYVKKWAWEGILPNKLDQLYITGKQSKAEHMVYGKVDVVVTDCPLLMGVFYDRKYNNLNTVSGAVDQFLDTTSDVKRINFFVQRAKKYIKEGRFCSEESAIETDAELMNFLRERGEAVIQLSGTIPEQVEQVLATLLS